MTRGLHRKTLRRTDYSHQKRYRQRGDQLGNKNGKKNNSMGALNDK